MTKRRLHKKLQAMTNRLVREEFPELAHLFISFSIVEVPCTGRWMAAYLKARDGSHGLIVFNTTMERAAFRAASDEQLEDIIRHELLHGDLARRGLPAGDLDLQFISEAVSRNIPVGDDSVAIIEARLGHKVTFGSRIELGKPKKETDHDQQ